MARKDVTIEDAISETFGIIQKKIDLKVGESFDITRTAVGGILMVSDLTHTRKVAAYLISNGDCRELIGYAGFSLTTKEGYVYIHIIDNDKLTIINNSSENRTLYLSFYAR